MNHDAYKDLSNLYMDIPGSEDTAMAGTLPTAPNTATNTSSATTFPTPTTSTAFPTHASPYAFTASDDTFLTPLISPAFEPSPHLNPDLLLSPLVSPALAATPQDLATLNAMTERWNSALASLASSPVFQPSTSSASSITIPHAPSMGAFTLSTSSLPGDATPHPHTAMMEDHMEGVMANDASIGASHSHSHSHSLSHALSGASRDSAALVESSNRKYASRRTSAPLGSLTEKKGAGSSVVTLHQLSPSPATTTSASHAMAPATVMGMRRNAAGAMGRTSSPITPAALMQLQGDNKVKASSSIAATKDLSYRSMTDAAPGDSGAPPDAGMRQEGEEMVAKAGRGRTTHSSSSSSPPPSASKNAPKPSRLSGRSVSAHVSSSATSSPSLAPGMASPMPSPSLAASPAGGPIRTGSSLSGPSPSLKPRLPSGVDEDVARSLAIRSNYSHIRSGKASTLGLDFDPTLSAEMEARRSSHKAAEQKRRDALKHCFQNLRAVVPEAGDEAASKTFLLLKSPLSSSLFFA
ncbi:hypothetical protein BJ684DRAFT_15871 [Piptocephalis cylindrospora]|uniref:BHLH domain-containing protein n=1 Tax=Piptocephalis cylindrospora TaxID=1907219 RepID=A0A4P9Y4Q1_9FUNG|nr:hypothetical protein BJ684DRAFT_15871 [Piptocephalis cylindrospora]|eukprot:RKP13764.1 hypothetical protein BJ684DRAFT_15871 [Piptocephalis cylindrospora]